MWDERYCSYLSEKENWGMERFNDIFKAIQLELKKTDVHDYSQLIIKMEVRKRGMDNKVFYRI